MFYLVNTEPVIINISKFILDSTTIPVSTIETSIPIEVMTGTVVNCIQEPSTDYITPEKTEIKQSNIIYKIGDLFIG